ncbi:MAG: Flagellar FliF M-ring protein [Proteobacteria bacterium]|nr:Flagellar FliF M-ring protein [Pseudomonadota bacterium]
MATSPETAPQNSLSRLLSGFGRLEMQKKLVLLVSVAAVIALAVTAYLWLTQGEYKVLFSNLSDKDGGAIVATLEQQNIPHQFSPGSGAILVPSSRVHEIRLKLAQQGLPRGGSIGFEIMDNPKFGLSQFAEQVNYQRALEGELARTISSIGAVQSARVHLAIPKPSVFVRDDQKPTASVLLNLYGGRTLDPAQISGITHLVASSVPQLSSGSVTIIDQSGALLSQLKSRFTEAGLDPAQIRYVREIEDSIGKRIEEILKPMLGPENYKVQVAADIDFAQTEQTAETYKPNNTPESTSIRSKQSTETASVNGPAGGIPGALTNQPPVPATAPITSPAVGTTSSATPPKRAPGEPGSIEAAGISAPLVGAAQPISTSKNATTNYEIDKTIRHTKQAMGSVRRLSAAVVVNHRKETGKTTTKPLADTEMKQINDLVRQAMGFSQERGDSLSVANAPFAAGEKPGSGFSAWKDPETLIHYGKDPLKYLLIAAIIAYLWFKVILPLFKSMFPPRTAAQIAAEAAQSARQSAMFDETDAANQAELNNYSAKLDRARSVAQQDPKTVANVIKNWISPNAA